MTRKAAIYLSAPVTRALDVVRAGADTSPHSISGRIASICDRYDQIIASAVPDLTTAEWTLVLAALDGGGALEDVRARPVPYAIAEVEDAIALHPHLRDGVDPQALRKKLRALDIAGMTALVEVAERWWASDAEDVEAFVAALPVPRPAARVTMEGMVEPLSRDLCGVCRAPISAERKVVAASRGVEAAYCSTRCRETARKRRARA